MHLLGTWRRRDWIKGWSPPDGLGDLHLRLRDPIIVLRENRRLFAYEGVLFEDQVEKCLEEGQEPEAIQGVFAYIRVDLDEDLIQIGTDLLGLAPLFYSTQPDGLVFGTCLSVVKHFVEDPTPDYEAWDEILNLDDLLGGKTVLREIRRLEAGQRIEIRNGSAEVKRSWSPRTPPGVAPDEYVRENNAHLLEGMANTRSDHRRKVVLLSGGDDSRRLAATAATISLPVVCATQAAIQGRGIEADLILAKQVAGALGLPHITERLATPQRTLRDAVLCDYWMGFESSQHAWVLPLVRKLPEGSLVYDGIVGDVTVNGHYFRRFRAERMRFDDPDHMAVAVIRESQGLSFRRGLVDTTLLERVRLTMQQMPDSAHRLTFFFLFNHTRRSIATWMELFRLYGHEVCAPYAHPPLFTQSLSLAVGEYQKHLYQRICTERLDPRMNGIPSTRRSLTRDLYVDLRRTREERLRFAARHLQIRSEVAELIPQLRVHVGSHRWPAGNLAWSLLPAKTLWWIQTAARFSRFLDWVEDRDPPPETLAPEAPAYVQAQFAALGLSGSE